MKYSIYILSCLFLGLIACNLDDMPDGPPIEPPIDPPTDSFQVQNVQDDWYDVTYISPKSYLIAEPLSSQGNNSYLLIGDDQAIMFDTGSGENDPVDGSRMMYIIDQLIDRPITLLLSHFHFDHNQNIGEFNDVAFPNIPSLQSQVGSDNIYHFTEEDLFEGSFPELVEVDEWFSLESDIDLGNRNVQVMNVPGHTDNSVAIIDHDNKLVFTGDAAYNGWLFIFDSADFIPYRNGIERLMDETGSDYRFFGAHGTAEVFFTRLENMLSLLNCIVDNQCTGSPGTIWGRPVEIFQNSSVSIVLFL